uniref:C1q domain-containing protein n=1 Tax=Monopterus albus TaxID=43700 RepID=A0A3Q3KP20_MONAL
MLLPCYLCRAQKHSRNNDALLQAPYVESEEEMAVTQKPGTETEGGKEELELHSDIWAELRNLRDMVVEQKVELRHLTTRVAAAESQVEALQKEHIVSKVAFSASLLDSGEGNTSGSFVPLIYRNVFTNIGNHYNPNTGYFTAPVRGAYYFRFTGHVANIDSTMFLRLVKNGQSMVIIGDRPTTSTDDNASNGVVLQLEVADVVSVQISGDVWDDQYHRTTFTGFLLFPL